MKRANSPTVDYFKFFKPMRIELWFIILASIILVGIMTSFVNRVSPYDHYGQVILNSSTTKEE